MNNLKSILNQTIRIPPPLLTEHNLPDQTNKIVIITGGYAGLGQELSRILYQKNATIYILGRSPEKASLSIAATKALFPDSKGRLEFISIDLADLSTAKGAAEEFLKREQGLDVLVNNAGVMYPPLGSLSAQNHELQMAVHALGHYLLTSLLLPALTTTLKSRVLWAGSMVIDVHSPPSGITFTPDTSKNNNPIIHKDTQTNYAQSKAASLFLAIEFGRRYPSITSLCFNPGSLETELLRHTDGLAVRIAKATIFHPAVFGAYTELGAGWGDVEGAYEGGKGWYGIPWGRNGWTGLRKDVLAAVKEGVVGEDLWAWCVRETGGFR